MDFLLADSVVEVMRKHMTLALDEALATTPSLVYIGEDVVHGGYYLVTGVPSWWACPSSYRILAYLM